MHECVTHCSTFVYTDTDTLYTYWSQYCIVALCAERLVIIFVCVCNECELTSRSRHLTYAKPTQTHWPVCAPVMIMLIAIDAIVSQSFGCHTVECLCVCVFLCTIECACACACARVECVPVSGTLAETYISGKFNSMHYNMIVYVWRTAAACARII